MLRMYVNHVWNCIAPVHIYVDKACIYVDHVWI